MATIAASPTHNALGKAARRLLPPSRADLGPPRGPRVRPLASRRYLPSHATTRRAKPCRLSDSPSTVTPCQNATWFLIRRASGLGRR